MRVGYSTHGCWAPLLEIKELEEGDRGNPWFDDDSLDLEGMEGIWVTKEAEKALWYLFPAADFGSEEYRKALENPEAHLFRVDLKGAVEVLKDNEGGFLYIRKKESIGTNQIKEVRKMWNEPSQEQLKNIPKLYETEDTPAQDKLIHLHFFLGGSDWYVAEYDGEDTFFGYAILNGDHEMAEWGYISFRELKELKIPPGFEVECEKFWKVRKAGDVEKIRAANHR